MWIERSENDFICRKGKVKMDEKYLYIFVFVWFFVFFGIFILASVLDDNLKNYHEIGEIEDIKSIGVNQCVVVVLDRDYTIDDCTHIKTGDRLFKSDRGYYVVKNSK